MEENNENNDEEIGNVLNELINNEDETTEKILDKKEIKEKINFMKPVISNIVVVFTTIICILCSIFMYDFIRSLFNYNDDYLGPNVVVIFTKLCIATIEGLICIFIVIKNSIKGILLNIKYLNNNKKNEINKLAILSTILLSIEIIIAVLMLIFLIWFWAGIIKVFII